MEGLLSQRLVTYAQKKETAVPGRGTLQQCAGYAAQGHTEILISSCIQPSKTMVQLSGHLVPHQKGIIRIQPVEAGKSPILKFYNGCRG